MLPKAQNWYLDKLLSLSFQVVNRSFVLSFENWKYMKYYLPKVEIKDCTVKIDGRNFFDQSINDDIKTWKYF